MDRNIFLRISLAILTLFIATGVIWYFDADRQLAQLVYDEETRWPGLNSVLWMFIYEYTAVPAFTVAIPALLVFLAGFAIRTLTEFRRRALFLVLLLVLGPGLVVNVLLKDNLGRARPRELVEFGGRYEFSQIWEKGATGSNSSFPSGHSSAAFYMIGPWFILRRKKPIQGYAWLAGGISYGILVGAARVLQGGHFLSDVLWAGGFVYLTGELLVLLLHPDISAKNV